MHHLSHMAIFRSFVYEGGFITGLKKISTYFGLSENNYCSNSKSHFFKVFRTFHAPKLRG